MGVLPGVGNISKLPTRGKQLTERLYENRWVETYHSVKYVRSGVTTLFEAAIYFLSGDRPLEWMVIVPGETGK